MKDVVPYCEDQEAQLAVNAQCFVFASQSWAKNPGCCEANSTIFFAIFEYPLSPSVRLEVKITA
jgi:hypothetical protein